MELSQLGIIFIEEWSLSYCGFIHETEDSIASVTPTEVLQTTEGLGKWRR